MNMMGAWNAKAFVTNYLTKDLPRRLTKYRNLWQLDDDMLPTPEKFLNFEPETIGSWPTVNTVAVSTKSMERVDYDASLNPEYVVTYVCRTYVWVRGDTAELAAQSRDLMMAVVREALLDYPCLKIADVLGRNVAIQEDTLREEFSELVPLKGDRFMAGGYLGYDLTLHETVQRDDLGVVVAVEIDDVVLLPYPYI